MISTGEEFPSLQCLQKALCRSRSAPKNAPQSSLSLIRSLTPSLRVKGVVYPLHFCGWWGPIPHRASTLGDSTNPVVTIPPSPTRTCFAAVCSGLLKSVLAYRTPEPPVRRPDWLGIAFGPDKFIDGGELLRVGAGASCVMVCRVAELAHTNTSAE